MTSMASSNERISETLKSYGAAGDGILLFSADGAHLLPYATLLTARRDPGNSLQALCGIYEWQHQPLAFLIDGELIENEEQLLVVRRRLAMRGDAPYLCVIGAGRLTIYRVGLDAAPIARAEIRLPQTTHQSSTVPYLSNTRPGLASKQRWIGQVVLTLLNDTITGLISEHGVASADAISLVGRALFVRFLADRGLLSDDDAVRIAEVPVARLFDSRRAATSISEWLDTTFNGDLLPLGKDSLSRLPAKAFVKLGNILHRAPGGQHLLQWKEDWAHLDFAYIPVGVLSQAYEHYLRTHDSQVQAKDGGYYTPASIAQMLVMGAIHALREDNRAHTAKVLDPAAGAGVFLVCAYRQLVAERWAHDQKRPTTSVLREVLYEQITGFDINEEALRFAALGLYLMAIELDANPHPVRKLRFPKNLRDRVLFKVGEHGSAGSLGDAVGAMHDGRYDIVTGNPPWSSSTRMDDWPQIVRKVRDVAVPRLEGSGFMPALPNEVLDLPFVWRAMGWCRPRGQIAFALHARLLFQQGDGMPMARNSLLSAVDITAIVNGADLRNSRVWPDVGAPFCLLFARNCLPTPASSFRFVTPRREDNLNAAGAFRLDVTNAPHVTPTQVVEQPEILKILYRGGPLDLELLGRMRLGQSQSVDDYWRNFGVAAGRAEWAGSGYQRLRPSSRTRKGENLPGESAAHLDGLPHLEVMPGSMQVNVSDLPAFRVPRVHHARPRGLYTAPLLLVHQSPPAHTGRLRVAVSDEDVVFTESFYGYSGHKHRKGRSLVRFLALVVGSRPALWYSLLTSGKFGMERETIEKSVIDSMFVPNFDKLGDEDLAMVNTLFSRVSSSNAAAAWLEVDAWVAKLYGLQERDVEVMSDTLTYNAPYADSRQAAQRRPARDEVDTFLHALTSSLNPIAQRFGQRVSAQRLDLPPDQPWCLIRLATKEFASPAVSGSELTPFLELADQIATTEVIAALDQHELLVAKLDQARHWTPTQARLLARRLVWEHRQHLFGAVQ